MIDHITMPVADVEKSKRFYLDAFAPLGIGVAFGKEDVFWAFDVGDGLFEIAQAADPSKNLTSFHVALRVSEIDHVQKFHEAAIKAGGSDNGAPGPRPEYTPGYYACFVLDPDGHNIEAMLDQKNMG